MLSGYRCLSVFSGPAKEGQAWEQLENPACAEPHLLASSEVADIDKSGEIGLGEAILLGIALSANALTNGLGAGLLGLSPHVLSFTTAAGSFISVWAGVSLGHKVADIRIGSFTLGESSTIVSGVILLLIAAHTLFS
jgi:Predicted membrane protein